MEKLQGYDEAVALTGEFEALEPGGYICKIVNAKEEMSSTNKKMLVIAFDIEEGEHKGFYQRKFDEAKKTATVDKPVKWQGVYRQMLDGEKAAGYLKGIMTSLEKSNDGFKWDWNEKKLVGLKFGGLFGKEEYENQISGERKMTTKIRFIRTVESVEDGKFEIPKDKLLPGNTVINNNTNESIDDLPF